MTVACIRCHHPHHDGLCLAVVADTPPVFCGCDPDADSVTVRRDDLEVLIMFAIASFKNTTRLPSAVTRLQEALNR